MAICVVAYITLMFSRSYLVTLISIFIVGVVSTMRSGIGFPYMLELVGKRHRAFYSTIYSIFGSLFGIFGGIFFLVLSRNAYYFMAVGCIL